VEIPRSSITDWDLHPILDPVIGHSFWKLLKDREWLWAGFPAIDGAIGHIGKLRDQGHYIELITSKPDWAEYNVYKWLGKWRLPIQRVTIVSLNDRKVDFTEADVLIDDKPENCEGFIKAGRKAILFNSHHNQSYHANGMVRAMDWPDVMRKIEAMQLDDKE
jgi:5'(3')-deoxyribonucleotidase